MLFIQAYMTRRLLREFIWNMILEFLLYIRGMTILFFSIFISRGHENLPILMLLMLWSMGLITSERFKYPVRLKFKTKHIHD